MGVVDWVGIELMRVGEVTRCCCRENGRLEERENEVVEF